MPWSVFYMHGLCRRLTRQRDACACPQIQVLMTASLHGCFPHVWKKRGEGPQRQGCEE